MENSNLSHFDAAQYLNSPEARLEYVRAALETEDLDIVMDALSLVWRAADMSKIVEGNT